MEKERSDTQKKGEKWLPKSKDPTSYNLAGFSTCIEKNKTFVGVSYTYEDV